MRVCFVETIKFGLFTSGYDVMRNGLRETECHKVIRWRQY